MWSYLILLLICFGAAVDGHNHAWETNNEYQYNVQTRTLTSVDKVNNQFSGILVRGILTIQVKSPELLRAVFARPQYAHVHTVLSEGWDAEIPEQQLEFRELGMSGKPFEIQCKHGLVRDLIVEQGVPIWEINILKSVVSQMQLDTQGENLVSKRDFQIPTDEEPYAMFTVMEDSIGGRCQVNYDITPLSEMTRRVNPELVPLPDLRYDGQFIDIIKTKNYSKCIEQSEYHFGFDDTGSSWKRGSYQGFLSKFSTSRVVISGGLKRYALQSSTTTNEIFVSPNMDNNYIGTVYSKVNLTLNSKQEISKPTLSSPSNPVSTGDLVYIYNNPFSDHEQFGTRHPSISRGSMPDQSSESSDSSSEERQRTLLSLLSNGQRGSDSSSSSSSSSDASRWKEQEHKFQHRPRLNEAPENPLLPLFIGYKGKNIQKSGKIELVPECTRLTKEIVREIQRPQDMTQATLEKFTMLIRLIRLMNVQQISELQGCNGNTQEDRDSPRSGRSQGSGRGDLEYVCWEVLRDAVTHAGTGPAFMTIKRWIKEGKLENLDAARVISIIPKVARTPTPEYLDEFFGLIKESTVKEQEFLNSTAPYAFAELVFNAEISKTRRFNRYPVHAYGPMIPKDNQAAYKIYIPYMGKELKEAIENNNSPRAQAYIMALGKFGHPQIFSIFEPYLEGAVPVSRHQRLMMVGSLNALAETDPKIVRPVLYKIYANAEEAHEVRCAAVYLLIKTNPPLGILQRMAQYTKYDRSPHVNSAVKSIIESLAELNEPQWRDLSDKARIASRLLTSKEFGSKYSQGYVGKMDYDLHVLDNILNTYTVTLDTIGSNDSELPKVAYLQYPTEFVFGQPKTQLLYVVSSIKQLLESLPVKDQGQQGQGRSRVDEIIRTLGLQPELQEPLEGTLLFEYIYGSHVYSFDGQIKNKMLKLMKQGLSMKQQRNQNYLHYYDMTVGFPTESGLPFTYSLEKPALMKIYAKNWRSQDSRSDSLVLRNENELDLAYVAKKMNRYGFVTPFEHEYYYAGVDKDLQLIAPIAYDFEKNSAEETARFRFRPNFRQVGSASETENESRWARYSVVPFTGRINVLDLQPLSLNKNTHVVRKFKNQQETQLNFDPVSVRMQSDYKYDENWYAFIKQIRGSKEYDATFKQIDLYLKNDLANDWITINTAYGKTDTNVHKQSEQSEQSWPVDMTDFPTTFPKEADNKERRDQMLKRVSKDIRYYTAQAVDVSLDIPYMKEKYIGTYGLMTSYANLKIQSFFYLQSLKNDATDYEICAVGHVHSSETSPINYEKAIEVVPENQYHVEMQFGSTCMNGYKFYINGTQTRSVDMKNAILKSNIVSKCKREMQEGNNALRACQKAIALAGLKNYLQLSLNYPEKSLYSIGKVLSSQLGINALDESSEEEISERKKSERKTTNMEVRMSPDYTNLEVGLHNSQIDFKLPPLDLSDLYPLKKEAEKLWKQEEDEVLCTLDRTQAITFDNKVYPLKIGKCQHVMLTTSLQQDSFDPSRPAYIPEYRKVAVLVQEENNYGKQVYIILGDGEIGLRKVGGQIEVKINKKKFEPISGSYRYEEGNEVIADIIELPDQSIEVSSNKYQLKSVYDGERIQVQLSNAYSNGIRGLCGNYDGQPDNDFISPKNCILSKPEEFSAMYALTERDCQGPALENKQRAERAKCDRPSNRQTNVISDGQAGRPTSENKHWGYHSSSGTRDKSRDQDSKRCTQYRTKVIENNDEICFTTRPVPKCGENCKPVEKKTKRMPLHCMPRNDASIQMKRRIEQGANPDLSLRSVSKIHTVELPFTCTAA